MKKQTLKIVVFSGIIAAGVSSPANAAVIYIDFTNAASASATNADAFNHLNNAASSSVALNDSAGDSTGATIAITTTPAGGNSGGATSVSGDAATAGFSLAVAERFHFSSGSSTASYTISGLAAMTNYTLTVFGSRNASDARPTEYTLGNGTASQIKTLAVSGPMNVSEVVVFDAIAASGMGNLVFSLKGLNTTGNQFGYVNAIRIDTAPIPEPTSALLLGSAGLLGLLRRRV